MLLAERLLIMIDYVTHVQPMIWLAHLYGVIM